MGIFSSVFLLVLLDIVNYNHYSLVLGYKSNDGSSCVLHPSLLIIFIDGIVLSMVDITKLK